MTDEKAIRSILWDHYPQVEAEEKTGSASRIRLVACACAAPLPGGWITHVAEQLKDLSGEPMRYTIELPPGMDEATTVRFIREWDNADRDRWVRRASRDIECGDTCPGLGERVYRCNRSADHVGWHKDKGGAEWLTDRLEVVAPKDADPGDHDRTETDAAARRQYEELARAVCEATGIVWPGRSLTGMKAALAALAEERDNLDNDVQQIRKRWHEAATQRDALVRAAREQLLDTPFGEVGPLAPLRRVVEQVESGTVPDDGSPQVKQLRRELWAVLDRMPASDDDLIAAVRALKRERDDVFAELTEQEHALNTARAEREAARGERDRAHGEAKALRVERDAVIRQHEKTADVMERARAQRDELLNGVHRHLGDVLNHFPKLRKVIKEIEEDRA